MGSRLGSLLYAAALVMVIGAGCATPRAIPTVASAPAPSASRSTSSEGASPTEMTLTPSPTSAPSSSRSVSSVRTSTAAARTTATHATSSATQGCGIAKSLLGKDLTVLPVTEKVVALTFDAGANANGVAPILATLAARQAPGTFFLTGAFVNAFPSASRQVAASYPIGNHTQNHKDLTQLTTAEVLAEIRTGAASIRNVTGVDPHPYFRFPYGAVNASTIALVNAECYVPFRWTVDTLGWEGTAGKISADVVLQRVVAALRPGAVVLMHVGSNPDDGTTFDADALPRVIDAIRAQGYTLVTLERVLPATP
jgi:peptidoglycan/xylan/chitin deacetylase (PgdA/CDA1 family)